jgi:starch synthase
MDLSADDSATAALASVLFVAPECAPLTKTGGLGDVCGALPAALRRLGVDVRVLVPGYTEVLAGTTSVELAKVSLLGVEGRLLGARMTRAADNDVPLLVLDCPALYERSGGPYQSISGEDWSDNPLRFALLSKVAAVLGSERTPLRWRPDVVHCHDWPAALAAAYLHLERSRHAACLLTIHNLAFQGSFDRRLMRELRLPDELFSVDGLEFHGRMSFLKAGIVYSDAVNTVSPCYAREIQTEEYGCGMDGLLRKRREVLSGILNGIDTALWNPSADPYIAQRYDASSLHLKAANKEALQRRMGLAIEAEVPLLGMVGRLTQQKGIDVALGAADELASIGQLAILGKGEREIENALRLLALRHPGRIAVQVGFDEGLAHLIEAGADLFLMPSRFEPCGLNQMYSQRYGTPPVARATGGLADTINDGLTGFLFKELKEESLVEAVKRTLATYRDRAAWNKMQRAAMACDFSWDAAARRYADLYQKLATLEAA